MDYLWAGCEIFADAAVLVKKPKKAKDSPDSATTFLYKSRYCDGCQHSEQFTYLLCETKGGDDRENIENTMETLHLPGQLIYYNNNIFYSKWLSQYISFGNKWIGDSKFIEGVQGVGNSLSLKFNPNSDLTSAQMRNPFRLLFQTNFIPVMFARDYEQQEKKGIVREQVLAGFALQIASKKASLMLNPGFILAQMIKTYREITNLTISWTLPMICDKLDYIIELGNSCIKSVKKNIPLWHDEISEKESLKQPKHKKKQKSAATKPNDHENDENIEDDGSF